MSWLLVSEGRLRKVPKAVSCLCSYYFTRIIPGPAASSGGSAVIRLVEVVLGRTVLNFWLVLKHNPRIYDRKWFV